MKKKLEPKIILTITIFIVGLVLMILGDKSVYCLGFGMILFGAGCFIYTSKKINDLNEMYVKLNETRNSYNGDDAQLIKGQNKLIKNHKRQTFATEIVFYGFSAMMIIIGFIIMI